MEFLLVGCVMGGVFFWLGSIWGEGRGYVRGLAEARNREKDSQSGVKPKKG